ncbi:MAG TPA: DsbA family oxidoreductase [Ilumatobacter sp.]|nr:DsbA family oxidoreductase [Ilumatobacter sp.]
MTGTAIPHLEVEIWSDVVCPWCYIGKRRFESALDELDGEIDVRITYRAYQLDPAAPPGSTMPVAEAYARKFGGPEQAKQMIDRVTETAASDGLKFRLDRAQRANTLLAHRLLWWSDQPDSPVTQEAVKERLLRAYFVDGLNVGDPDTLADCAAEVGFDRDAVVVFLESSEGQAEVAAQIEQARDLDISAVPTFVINGQWAIPGAQEADTFVNVLRRAAARVAGAAQG